ncbi:MAG: alpha/beta hydrolase [archaeon]|nr:alpha/beta hydrolase [archaeon]
MKIFLFIFVLYTVSFGVERYRDRLFDVHIERNVVFAENVPHLAQKHYITLLASGLNTLSNEIFILHFFKNTEKTLNENLNADVYFPKNDLTRMRPFVIVVHGGAFVEGSRHDQKQTVVSYCDSLAARGYVVASIDYRIGLVLDGKGRQLFVDSLDIKRAILWGVQDLERAFSFFRRNSESYGIDPENFFIIGSSSGAMITLHFAFNIEKKARALVSLWGAVLDSGKIRKISSPVLLVHGTNDEIVPFKVGVVMNIDSIKETGQLLSGYATAAAAFNIDFLSPVFYGSFAIDSVLKEQGLAHETFFAEKMGHEFATKEPYRADVLKKIVDFLYKFQNNEGLENAR